jgi:uncharacterized protein
LRQRGRASDAGFRRHLYDGAVPTLERLDARALRDVITTFRDAVRDHAAGLNRLNVYPVPDGDTGTNMARTLDAVVAEMELASRRPRTTCDAISHGSLMGARGNSGVILSQILRGLSSTLHGAEAAEAGRAPVAEALSAASAGGLSGRAQAHRRHDPHRGARVGRSRQGGLGGAGGSLAEVLQAARDAGKLALDNTPDLLPVLRTPVWSTPVVPATCSSSTQRSTWSTAAAATARRTSTSTARPDRRPLRSRRPPASAVDGELDVSEQRYEVMYFLEIDDARIEAFKQGWGAIGDSIVVVGGDGLWNCHVHTNDIGAAIEVALDEGGRPRQIRITDLFEEVADEHAAREAAFAGSGSRRRPAWRRRRAPVSRRSPARWSPCAAATAWPSCSPTCACRASSAGDRRSTRPRPSCSMSSSTSTPTRSSSCRTTRTSSRWPNRSTRLTSKTVVVVPTRTMPEALAALIVYDPEAGVR